MHATNAVALNLLKPSTSQADTGWYVRKGLKEYSGADEMTNRWYCEIFCCQSADLSRVNMIWKTQSKSISGGESYQKILSILWVKPRTALLLRTEMSILRVDKMRLLFQEAIVTKLSVTQSTTRYQMKATDIIFPMIPHEYPWVK